MAETSPNPFENTNSGPTAPASDATAVDTACCTAAKTARTASRVLLYAPVVLLFVGIVAVSTVPGLADYASPILNLVNPNFGKVEGTGCCSSMSKDTESCCSHLSKATMLTSSVSHEEISLDSGASMDDDSCACCSGDEGSCPLSKASASETTSEETLADESDE